MHAPYRHIVCCVDRSGASLAVLDLARRLRDLGPGRLTLVHVAPWGLLYGGYPGVEPEDPALMVDDARAWLDEMTRAHPGSDAVLLNGHPPAAACEWARANQADLLVAASSRGLLDRAFLGSFAGYLLHHAPCPVLLTRPRPHAEHRAEGDRDATGAGG